MIISKTVLNKLSEKEIVFLVLLRAGLWEKDVELQSYAPVDFNTLYDWADEQSIIGLIGAGLEHITDKKAQKMEARPFLKRVYSIEKRNIEMNEFIGRLATRLHNEGVSFVLIKGQGIAQCYSRPLWRASGDIDLLLNAENYEKAKRTLWPLASSIATESPYIKHIGMSMNGFEVELHGTFTFGLSKKVDHVIDRIQDLICSQGQTRIWHNEESSLDINLPSVDNDVLIIFTHFLRHLFKGGIGLRQICDWCRLLWEYQGRIDESLLRSRLNEAGLMKEWKAFAAYAVDYLGMPEEAMPFFDDRFSWHSKAYQLHRFIMRVGNFGHNRDMSYYNKYPYVIRKAISAMMRISDSLAHFRVFQWDSVKYMCNSLIHGVRDALKGV